MTRSFAPALLVAFAAACGGGSVGVEQLKESTGGRASQTTASSGAASSGSGSRTVTVTDTESETTSTPDGCCVTETSVSETTDTFSNTFTGSSETETFSSQSQSFSSGSGSASACIEVAVEPSQQSCHNASDCSFVPSGLICTGECGCGTTPVNAAGASEIESEIAGLGLEACPCDIAGQAECIQGVCTLCGFGPGQPPGCNASDAGVGESDGGISTGECVDVNLATSDTLCAQASDCILIASGELCTGDCFCPGSAVNASERSKYDQAVAGIQQGECGCPATPAPLCIAGQCVECMGGPYDPSGCPADAGF